jgi:prophage regulatory protein
VSKILRLRDVLADTGLSRTTVYRLIQAGSFPPGVRLSDRAVGWPEEVVEQWKESRPSARAA